MLPLVFCLGSGTAEAGWDHFKERIVECRVTEAFNYVEERLGRNDLGTSCDWVEWEGPLAKVCNCDNSLETFNNPAQFWGWKAHWFQTYQDADAWWNAKALSKTYNHNLLEGGAVKFYDQQIAIPFRSFQATERVYGVDVDKGNIGATGILWFKTDRFIFQVGEIARNTVSMVREDLKKIAGLLLGGILLYDASNGSFPMVLFGGFDILKAPESGVDIILNVNVFPPVDLEKCSLSVKLEDMKATATLDLPIGDAIPVSLAFDPVESSKTGHGIFSGKHHFSSNPPSGIYKITAIAQIETVNSTVSLRHPYPNEIAFCDGDFSTMELRFPDSKRWQVTEENTTPPTTPLR
jgi:hypothetical protein